MLKELVIFAAGAAIGTIGGCIFFKMHYEKIAREEIQSVKDAFDRRMEEIEGEDRTSLKDPSIGADTDEKPESEITNANSLASNYKVSSDVDYTKYYKASNVDPAEEEHPEEEVDEELDYIRGEALNEEIKSKKGKKPILIKADDFGETFETMDLYYYTDDDVLANDAEEMIGENDGGELYLVGDCLEKFGFKTDDSQKTVYVRNYDLGIDYCVTKIWGAYVELCT